LNDGIADVLKFDNRTVLLRKIAQGVSRDAKMIEKQCG
jgi:hypothetical protein